MTKTALTALFAAVALVGAACGGGSGATASGKTPADMRTHADHSTDAAAALQRSVAVALKGNYRVAVYVLWHNRVPGWAKQTTAGPALASLRSAATARQKRGVRVRMLTDSRRLLELRLDPSYATATAVILDSQRVQPSSLAGRPLGKTVVLHERARYELRRVGQTERFRVWKVVLLQ